MDRTNEKPNEGANEGTNDLGRSLNRAWGAGYEAGCLAIDTGVLPLNPYPASGDEHNAWELGVDDAYADEHD